MAQFLRIVLGRPLYRYSRITPQLYLGGQHRKRGWPSMQKQGINAVVNLRREVDDVQRGIAPEHYLYLPTIDNTPPSFEDLSKGVQFIKTHIEAGNKVYVHCAVGVGRAPTMVAAYLVSTGLSPAAAWRQIREVRPFIWPMPSQMNQISQFADYLANGE